MQKKHKQSLLKKSTLLRDSRAGFTLVMTIAMMVLLSMIAVGFLSLSAVTLRASTSSLAMREAQNNARMSLLLALGELQRQMGPDQRISANANIAGNTLGIQLAPGAAVQNNTSVNNTAKGLTSVQNGTRYWVGSFVNVDNLNSIYTRTPSANLRQWLVSGNHLLGSAGPRNTPNTTTCVVGAGGSVSNPQTAAVLVGAATAGVNPENYVAAPIVPIMKENQTVGRYAWWIGDEGAKSLINRRENSIANTDMASLQPTRRAFETVTGLQAYPFPPADTSAIEKIISSEQLELVLGGNNIAARNAFHSFTHQSNGVIADALNGGTRIDLSQIMNGALPTTVPPEFAMIPNYPRAGRNIIPSAVAPNMQAPRWDNMLEFFQRNTQLNNGRLTARGPQTVASRIPQFPTVGPGNNNQSGYRTSAISPLIVDFRLIFGIRFRVNGQQFKMNPCGKIAVSLANPYSVPLQWERDLELEVMDTSPNTNNGYEPSCIWQHKDARFINRARPSVFGNTIFRIPPGTLPAGEARVYSLAAPVTRPVSSTNLVTVPMAPVTISLQDFNICVEMDTPTNLTMPTGSNTLQLDVRESWQTTSATVELRSSGGSASSGNLLRRIERFELDNGYFSPNTRNFNASEITGNRGPVPMMLYSYQISQPGADYANLMPADHEIGLRGSTLRTFMDFNLQAVEFAKPIAGYTPPPYFMQSNNSIAALGTNSPGGTTGSIFTQNLASNPLAWGRSLLGGRRTVLFTVPERIVTLAQLQHADLTGDDTGTSIGHQSGYAFGNSYASPFVLRQQVLQQRTDYELHGSGGGATSLPRNYYDISHLLNTAIWDSYFLSTLNNNGSSGAMNPVFLNLTPLASVSNDPATPASQLMIQGAFNVNSTDKNAWKAFLGSTRFFRHRADTSTQQGVAFPRSLEQPDTSLPRPTGTDADSFAGYRRITDAELDLFAEEMVRQVRIRGPFLSLSHFVNRALAEPTRFAAITRSGALQSALDESGCNINFQRNRNAFSGINPNTDTLSIPDKNGLPRADLDGGDTDSHPGGSDWAYTSRDNNFGTTGSIYAERSFLSQGMRAEQGYRSTGIPGWINQADVLQAIGSSISVRSDTFRIRAYGESTGADGNPKARAWCEAIVQRVPEYVDPTNAATLRGTSLSNINRNYGRKFNLVSFRWLGANNI